MAHRMGRVGFAPRAVRRKTDWIASADITALTNLIGGGVVIDQSLTGAQVALIAPFTIIRTVGYVGIRSDQAGATETPFGAIGAMVVKETARAAGVASVPTPINEEGDDGWFLYQGIASDFLFASGVGFSNSGMKIFQFDSKAQRKVADGDAIIWTAENASADGFDYLLKFRMLVKLH